MEDRELLEDKEDVLSQELRRWKWSAVLNFAERVRRMSAYKRTLNLAQL